MNVFEQKNAELVTELTATSGNIQTSPNGFQTTPWWPCWLKEMKNSIDGVKTGQSGRLKKDNRSCM